MYLAVLGREPNLSNAELEALFSGVKRLSENLSLFESKEIPDINRLGGVLKLARRMDGKVLDYLFEVPEGKITIGISDYSKNATLKSVKFDVMKLKKILTRQGRSVRAVMGDTTILSTATSLHNGLSGKNPRKIELIKVENIWYKVIGVQDIEAYARRDQGRPARDARVGMLPPKLAQILINLCGPLKKGSVILDPFCGTGVVLQEALLMGYRAYGTDISERMVEYALKNIKWLLPYLHLADSSSRATNVGSATGTLKTSSEQVFCIAQGDATSFFWKSPVDAVACEGYLGKPMSKIPSEMELKEQKQECADIVLSFLKNLSGQIKKGTPVVMGIPAWLREDGVYSRLDILDLIQDMGYNVENKSREGLLYFRDGQVVARDIIILRKD